MYLIRRFPLIGIWSRQTARTPSQPFDSGMVHPPRHHSVANFLKQIRHVDSSNQTYSCGEQKHHDVFLSETFGNLPEKPFEHLSTETMRILQRDGERFPPEVCKASVFRDELTATSHCLRNNRRLLRSMYVISPVSRATGRKALPNCLRKEAAVASPSTS